MTTEIDAATFERIEDVPLTPEMLRYIRKNLMNATQAQLAAYLSMPVRTYEDMEAGRVKTRGVHLAAITYATMAHYLTNEDARLPWYVMQMVEQVHAKMRATEPVDR